MSRWARAFPSSFKSASGAGNSACRSTPAWPTRSPTNRSRFRRPSPGPATTCRILPFRLDIPILSSAFSGASVCPCRNTSLEQEPAATFISFPAASPLRCEPPTRDSDSPEAAAMAGAPPSDMNLWSTQDQLMPYDIVLLSCEGGETYDANPPALEAYLNAGGRAFGSHYHYAWFSGPIGSGQAYSAPADWGTHLANWTANGNSGSGPIGGTIDTTLNGSAKPFPKGVALDQWLGPTVL